MLFTHQLILLTQEQSMEFLKKNIESSVFFELSSFDFFFQKKMCFITMKMSHSFLSSKDGSKSWWLPWCPAQTNSCLNICNTVYVFFIPRTRSIAGYVVKQQTYPQKFHVTPSLCQRISIWAKSNFLQ
jgi:hypothetical protein